MITAIFRRGDFMAMKEISEIKPTYHFPIIKNDVEYIIDRHFGETEENYEIWIFDMAGMISSNTVLYRFKDVK